MKKQLVHIACITILAVFSACSELPLLADLTSDLRDNPADPEGVAPRSWIVAGTVAVSSGTGTFVSLAVHAGIPYVGFAQGIEASVWKLEGDNWIDVNPSRSGLTLGPHEDIDILVINSIPYLLIKQSASPPECKSLVNGTWTNLGFPPISAAATNISMASNNSELFIACTDAMLGRFSHYNGMAWNNNDFAAAAVNPEAISLGVNGGFPYVAFTNHDLGGSGSVSAMTTFVMPPAWIYLTNSSSNFLTTANMEETSIAFVNNVLHVASMITGSVTVKKYVSANTWTAVGTMVTTSGTKIKMATAADGTLYLAYKDMANNRITVKKYDGSSSWVTVGVAGFSGAVNSTLDFKISQTDGTLYVAYDNADNTNQIQVMKFK
jgi:hypothetical protein